MEVLADIQLALELAPGVVSFVQQLIKMFSGNKASAQTVAMAAIAHPSLTDHQKGILTSVIDNALKVL